MEFAETETKELSASDRYLRNRHLLGGSVALSAKRFNDVDEAFDETVFDRRRPLGRGGLADEDELLRNIAGLGDIERFL